MKKVHAFLLILAGLILAVIVFFITLILPFVIALKPFNDALNNPFPLSSDFDYAFVFGTMTGITPQWLIFLPIICLIVLIVALFILIEKSMPKKKAILTYFSTLGIIAAIHLIIGFQLVQADKLAAEWNYINAPKEMHYEELNYMRPSRWTPHIAEHKNRRGFEITFLPDDCIYQIVCFRDYSLFSQNGLDVTNPKDIAIEVLKFIVSTYMMLSDVTPNPSTIKPLNGIDVGSIEYTAIFNQQLVHGEVCAFLQNGILVYRLKQAFDKGKLNSQEFNLIDKSINIRKNNYHEN